MTNEEWKIIHEVHLKGAYKVTKAAWEYFIRQGFGRIIMTISAAGLYGNAGQTNYGSGKQ
jgi:NAD(P)-dependent dehydrogenase (short-subunit alcohol dehydrogenase family)